MFVNSISYYNYKSNNFNKANKEPSFGHLILSPKQYKDIAKSDEDVLSIALFGDVAIKFIEQRNEDAIPTLIHVEA